MNYYEILNVEESASQQEIEKAYQIGKTSFTHNSLAHYGVIDEEERSFILEKIEDALQTLKNTRKRKNYDVKVLSLKNETSESTYYRKSTEKMVIEDGTHEITLWGRIKMFLRRN